MRRYRLILYSPKKYSFVDITKKFKTGTVLALILLVIILIITIQNQRVINKVKLIPQETKMLVIKEMNKFSKKKLILEMKRMNLKFPHIVYAQAIQESGFRSAIFYENNNFCGMKKAMNRPTTSIGVNRNHAVFKNWRDCLIDYALYQAAYMRHINTEEQYFQFLKGYAEDPNYVNTIRRESARYKEYFQ